MATEYNIKSFLDARGKLTVVGAKAPDESEENLNLYRNYRLIGTEAVTEQAVNIDVGRPGKAATRKKAKASD